ncbi:MAG: hypothetical protein IJZ61_00950 [Oscillospiraceae bacterium]|nr:hypothetical protein [Oscillospiraceae bacterium]
MKVNVLEEKQRVEIWLTQAESNDKTVSKEIEKIKNDFRSKKYYIVIFRSGTGNLFENTNNLILHNKAG